MSSEQTETFTTSRKHCLFTLTYCDVYMSTCSLHVDTVYKTCRGTYIVQDIQIVRHHWVCVHHVYVEVLEIQHYSQAPPSHWRYHCCLYKANIEHLPWEVGARESLNVDGCLLSLLL